MLLAFLAAIGSWSVQWNDELGECFNNHPTSSSTLYRSIKHKDWNIAQTCGTISYTAQLHPRIIHMS